MSMKDLMWTKNAMIRNFSISKEQEKELEDAGLEYVLSWSWQFFNSTNWFIGVKGFNRKSGNMLVSKQAISKEEIETISAETLDTYLKQYAYLMTSQILDLLEKENNHG